MKAFALLLLIAGPLPAAAGDPAHWSGDPARAEWFRSLYTPGGSGHPVYSCCDEADGQRIALDRVRQAEGRWFVNLGKGFVPVPPDRVVTEPKSIDGEAYVFIMPIATADSPDGIRCFIPPIPGF